MSVPLAITTYCYIQMFMALYKVNNNFIKNKMWKKIQLFESK